jgi:DnaJ-class molecular chaperone
MQSDLLHVNCPYCDGSGEQLVVRLFPSGHTECYEDCGFCEGIGNFEEGEYLILKLEGKV